MMQKDIIITADDFGISQEANDQIFRLIDLGKISRVSVIANGTINSKEAERLKSSGVKIDLHLVLFKEKEKRELRGSVLGRLMNFIFCYFSGKIKVPVVKIKWEKQLTRFIEIFGKKPDGLNSHEHIHFFPSYFKVVSQLANSQNIPFIRLGERGLLGEGNLVAWLLSFLRGRNLPAFLNSTALSTDYMVSLDWIDNFSSFSWEKIEGSMELVIHPERIEEFELIRSNF